MHNVRFRVISSPPAQHTKTEPQLCVLCQIMQIIVNIEFHIVGLLYADRAIVKKLSIFLVDLALSQCARPG